MFDVICFIFWKSSGYLELSVVKWLMARSLVQLEARCVGKFVVVLAKLDYPSQDGTQHKTRQDSKVLLQGTHANVDNITW